MRNFIYFLIASLFCLVGFVTAEEKSLQLEPLTDQQLNKYQYCGSDMDCVAVINGCCDCSQGGSYVAISKDRVADFTSKFDCLKANCPESDRSACKQGVVSCVEHKCRYF